MIGTTDISHGELDHLTDDQWKQYGAIYRLIMTANKSFYNFEKIEERWQKKFKKIIAHNVGYMTSSGINSTNLSN